MFEDVTLIRLSASRYFHLMIQVRIKNQDIYLTYNFDQLFNSFLTTTSKINKQLENLGLSQAEVLEELNSIFKKAFAVKLLTNTLTHDDLKEFDFKKYKKN